MHIRQYLYLHMKKPGHTAWITHLSISVSRASFILLRIISFLSGWISNSWSRDLMSGVCNIKNKNTMWTSLSMILWVVFFYLQDFLHTNIHVRVLLKHLHLIIEMNYNRKKKNIVQFNETIHSFSISTTQHLIPIVQRWTCNNCNNYWKLNTITAQESAQNGLTKLITLKRVKLGP